MSGLGLIGTNRGFWAESALLAHVSATKPINKLIFKTVGGYFGIGRTPSINLSSEDFRRVVNDEPKRRQSTFFKSLPVPELWRKYRRFAGVFTEFNGRANPLAGMQIVLD